MAKTRIDDLAVVVSASTEQLANDLGRAARMVQNFAKSVGAVRGGDIQVAKNAAGDLSAARRITDNFVAGAKASLAHVGHAGKSAFGTVAKGAASAAGSVVSFARDVAATAGGMALAEAGLRGIGGAVEYVKESVRAAADLESTTMGFEVLLKSASDAQSMIKGIRQYAASTPFNSKDITDAARSMLAFGVASDQVLPTVKMLGDVSAAFGKDLPIGRLGYLYGTLFAQQRAYTVDVKQFAQAGIPIWEELGKVTGKTTNELHGMVEEGRIGRDEITKAFKNMTSEGGRFAGMTARLGDTTAGTWEQMSDAFALVKVKFGQVLIDGLGLKGAFKDMTAFAERVESQLDRVKPFIGFLGDLGRAVAQVGYEFLRAAPKVGEVFVKQLDHIAPEIRAAGNRLHAIIKDAVNFRLDPVVVAEFGVSAGQALIDVGIEMVDIIGRAGNALSNSILKPMVAAAENVGWLIGRVRAGANFWNEWGNPFQQEKLDQMREKRHGFEYPKAGMFPVEIVRNYRVIADQIKADEAAAADGKWWKQLSLGDLRTAEERFVEHFPFDKDARAKLQRGEAPVFNEKPPNLLADFNADNLVKAMRERRKELGKVGDEIIENTRREQRLAAQLAQEAEWMGKVNAAKRMVFSRRATEEEIRAGMLPAMLTPFDTFGTIARAMPAFQKQETFRAAEQSMQFAPFPFGQAFRRPDDGVRLMKDVPAHLLDLEKRLKAEYMPLNVAPLMARREQLPAPQLPWSFKFDVPRFAPLKIDAAAIEESLRGTKLGLEKADLDALLAMGRIDRGTHSRAWNDAVSREAERLGIGGQYRLPDAAMKDTTESVRILNQWAAGQSKQSTESLLQQMVRWAEMSYRKLDSIDAEQRKPVGNLFGP